MEPEVKSKVDVVIEPTVEVDVIAAKDEEIARLTEDLNNYKIVALKRLGKLPADNAFLDGKGEEMESLIEEKVKAILIDKEINKVQAEKDAYIKQVTKENNELRIALKNRPNSGIGGGGNDNGGIEVKDNVFSNEQKMAMTERAKKLGVDPEKFIEKAKVNFLARR